MTLNVYAHALPDDEDDLSYLPGSGAGTGAAPAGHHELVEVSLFQRDSPEEWPPRTLWDDTLKVGV